MAYSADLKSRVLDKVARSTVFVWLGQGCDHVPSKPGPKTSRKIDRQRLFETLQQEPNLMRSDLNPIEKL